MVGELFLDRSLGRKRLAAALRADGWSLATLSEVYGAHAGQHVPDVSWIAEQTSLRRVLVTSDANILSDPIERQALIDAEALLFCFPTAQLTSAEQHARLTTHRGHIERLAKAWDVPGAYVLYGSRISRVLP
ncbi:hypothetical protein [Microbacterium sp.]|uniref:PIN-like domain-containing protein n=1 Tax=Microbacterium sp. TaxID=51671 RepID=UPI0039E2DF68